MEDKYYRFLGPVKKAAAYVASNFPEIEEEDLFQELMLFVLKKDGLTDPNEKFVALGLRRQASVIAWTARKKGQYITPQYAYQTSEVRRALEEGALTGTDFKVPVDFSDDGWENTSVMRSDIIKSYYVLSPKQRRHVFKRYVLGEVPSDGNGKQMVNIAVARMTDIMNFYDLADPHEGVGNRKVISNALSNYKIGNSYDGS